MLVAYMRPDMFAELKKGSAETLILALLAEGPRHGYELGKMIEDRTRGRLSFHVANVYTSLYRLEQANLIVGRWVEKAGQRRRRFYRLTAAGKQQLAVRRRHWREFVGAVDIVLRPASS
jgi:PadR family transcriptional regulator PadR